MAAHKHYPQIKELSNVRKRTNWFRLLQLYLSHCVIRKIKGCVLYLEGGDVGSLFFSMLSSQINKHLVEYWKLKYHSLWQTALD